MTDTRSLPIVAIALLASVGSTQSLPCETLRLIDPSPADSSFGRAVALRGERMIVGAPNIPSPWTGRASVFERTGAGWNLAGVLTASDGQVGDDFGYAVAIDGDQAVVGRITDGALLSKGSAYAFTRQPDGAWLETQKLTIPDTECWAFGWSLAMEGDRAVIAAKGASALGGKGRVFVFEREGDAWVQRAKIKPSLDNFDDWFGASVALDGDRLVVGAPKGGTGRAYVFDRQPNGEWVEQALLLPSDLASADEYGYSVAVRGDAVAVGAIAHDKPFINGGAVYLFEKGPEGWHQAHKFAEQPWGALPRYGYSVALSDDALLVGAPVHSLVAPGAGIVYRYERVGGSEWADASPIFGSSPQYGVWFGAALAQDGAELAIGAPGLFEDAPGRVHLFSFEGGAHLDGASPTVPLGSGGAQPMQLGACAEHAGDFYLVLGSASGTQPALPLGKASLPLLYDFYLEHTLFQPNSPILVGSLGVLDPWGRAEATFALPANASASAVGLTLHHAFLVVDSATLEIELASNAIPVLLAP